MWYESVCLDGVFVPHILHGSVILFMWLTSMQLIMVHIISVQSFEKPNFWGLQRCQTWNLCCKKDDSLLSFSLDWKINVLMQDIKPDIKIHIKIHMMQSNMWGELGSLVQRQSKNGCLHRLRFWWQSVKALAAALPSLPGPDPLLSSEHRAWLFLTGMPPSCHPFRHKTPPYRRQCGARWTTSPPHDALCQLSCVVAVCVTVCCVHRGDTTWLMRGHCGGEGLPGLPARSTNHPQTSTRPTRPHPFPPALDPPPHIT